MKHILLFCSVALASSCGPHVIDARDYDQSCAVVEECVAVVDGDLCGCGSPTAINADDVEAFQADAATLREGCIDAPWVISECFSPQFDLACDAGTCGRVVPPRPPLFSFSSPVAAVLLPTNSVIAGRIVSGTNPDEQLRAELLVDGEAEPRALTFSQAHCAVIDGCEDVIELGALPPDVSVRLDFVPATPGQEANLVTGEGPDTTPPAVELSLENIGVFRNETRRMFKQVSLRYAEPTDDVAIANFGLMRSIDGGEPVLLARIAGSQTDNVTVDQISETSGFREACYRLLAWDLAQNEAQTEPVCVDVTISDEEQRSISSCASVLPSGPFGLLFFLLGARRRREDGRPSVQSVGLLRFGSSSRRRGRRPPDRGARGC